MLIYSLYSPSSLVFVACVRVMSSLPAPSDNREEAKRPARRTQFGKGDYFYPTFLKYILSCSVYTDVAQELIY